MEKIELINFIEGIFECKIHYSGGEIITLPMTPIEYLYKTANCFGSNLNGRRSAIKSRFNYQKKIPIFFALQCSTILFPTAGLANKNCVWINYSKCRNKIYQDEKLCSTLTFTDYSKLKISMSSRSVRQQLNRCSQIDHWKRNQNTILKFAWTDNLRQYYNNFQTFDLINENNEPHIA